MEKPTKPIKAARCKHMPTKKHTVVIFSSKHGDHYKAGFTIGNQDFTVGERETKQEAKWMCDMLQKAFENLIYPDFFENFKNKEAAKDGFYPIITIENK